MNEFNGSVPLNNQLNIDYIRATRCWQANNLKECLLICDQLTKNLNKLILLATSTNQTNRPSSSSSSLDQRSLYRLKQLIWFLKLRCLADDYYINESLLLNEDDIENNDDQVRVISSTTRQIGRVTTAAGNPSRASSRRLTSSRDGGGGGGGTVTSRKNVNTAASSGTTIEPSMISRPRTGMLTGRMASILSRQSSGRATSSYRPLTTNLTATQTAFSRSTKPLLKYSTCQLLSKLAFEYLYNAQTITNKCPDYRQCLEYLNLVQDSRRKRILNQRSVQKQSTTASNDISSSSLLLLSSLETTAVERKSLGVFWLVAFGTCYYNLHMIKEAEEYFQQASALEPKYLDSYTWLVKIYLRLNQIGKILKTCKDGLNQCKNSILYNWLARIQSLTNDLYGANVNLREALKYYPTNIEALANVGHFAFYSDKLEQSLKCFERIQQLSINQSTNNLDDDNFNSTGNSAQLLNNLALCNFYSGFYHEVLPLFQKAFLKSPSKDVTSDIWYNISFVPLSLGLKNLAIACLRLAIKNNSHNEEAINNLGVLKCNYLINDSSDYKNIQEFWGNINNNNNNNNKFEDRKHLDLSRAKNLDKDQVEQVKILFDEAETYFNQLNTKFDSFEEEDEFMLQSGNQQPEMLYNMALIKNKRGQLLDSVKYCCLYLEQDPNNYFMKNMLREMEQLVSHDG